MEVLYITRRPFCAFGYDRLLREQLGPLPELEGFCDKVRFEAGGDGFYVPFTDKKLKAAVAEEEREGDEEDLE